MIVGVMPRCSRWASAARDFEHCGLWYTVASVTPVVGSPRIPGLSAVVMTFKFNVVLGAHR